MSDITEALNALKTQTKNARYLLTVADALERVGNLEQVAREADARAADAQRKAADSEAVLARAHQAVADVDAIAKQKMQAADQWAASTEAKARELSESLIKGANEEAARIMDRAKQAADDAGARLSITQAQLAQIDAQIKSEGAKLAAIKDEKSKLLAKLS